MRTECASNALLDKVLQNYLYTRQIYCEKPISVLVDGFQHASRYKKWLQKKWSHEANDKEISAKSSIEFGSAQVVAAQDEVEVHVLYFLSHYHSDHFSGISSGWKHGLIFGSYQTIALLESNLRVCSSQTHALSLGKKHLFSLSSAAYLGEFDEDISSYSNAHSNSHFFSVFLTPANHCPGAVMFVFESPDFGTIIHTGDFRFARSSATWRSASARAINFPSKLGTFNNSDCIRPLKRITIEPPFYEQLIDENVYLQKIRGTVDTLFLDNTFCDPCYDFPDQHSVLQHALKMLCDLLTQKADLFDKGSMQSLTERAQCSKKRNNNEIHCALLVGTYTIGKERLAFAFQETFLPLSSSSPGKEPRPFVPIYVPNRKYLAFKAMSYYQERFANLDDESSSSQTREEIRERLPTSLSACRNRKGDTHPREELVFVKPLGFEISLSMASSLEVIKPSPLLNEIQPPLVGQKCATKDFGINEAPRYLLSIFLVPMSSVSYLSLQRACGSLTEKGRVKNKIKKCVRSSATKKDSSSLLSLGEGLGINLSLYDTVLALDGSGWNKKCRLHCVDKDHVWLLKLPYSEHCNFSELLDFVEFVNPKRVVPTVSLEKYSVHESLFVEKAPRLFTCFSNTQPIARFFAQKNSVVQKGRVDSREHYQCLSEFNASSTSNGVEHDTLGRTCAPNLGVKIAERSSQRIRKAARMAPLLTLKKYITSKVLRLQSSPDQEKHPPCKSNALYTEIKKNELTNNCEFIIIKDSDDDVSVEQVM